MNNQNNENSIIVEYLTEQIDLTIFNKIVCVHSIFLLKVQKNKGEKNLASFYLKYTKLLNCNRFC